MMRYEIVSIPITVIRAGEEATELEEMLNEGYKIVSAVATGRTAQYVLLKPRTYVGATEGAK